MNAPLLQARALSKNYGNLVALEGVSFDLQPGEVLGVVGRRGSGKSTLLNILGGAAAPTSGEILFDGQPLHLSSAFQAHPLGIELVPQQPKLVDRLDLVNNIFLGRELRKPGLFHLPDQDSMVRRAKELLAELDLPYSLLCARMDDLTDEQRNLVTLARAFCQPARLLLLDDVLASLSYPRQQQVLARLKDLAGQGAGVIVSSDNLKHLFSITDRILVLYEKRVAAEMQTGDCTPRQIVELIVGASHRDQVTPVIWALESYHAAQRQTEELFNIQANLHKSLEASDSLNRELVERLSDQVKALDRLNAALQDTQRRLMTEREEERKYLARELHDQVIQDLLSLNYRLEEVESEDMPADHLAELSAIRTGIRQAVSDLRQYCRDLRPPTIDNHGLVSAIRSLADEWSERSGVKVEVNIDSHFGRLPEAIELSVFRIVQEGINNVAKHASAQKVKLTLKRTSMDSLLVRIADDGQGIDLPPDLASLTASKHFGLVGISERAALLGGSMRIKPRSGGGLVLEVEFPSPFPSNP